jgi:hypothetical protein
VLDPAEHAAWAEAAAQRGLEGQQMKERLVLMLDEMGITVATSIEELLPVLDEILMSAEEAHQQWWCQQPMLKSVGLEDKLASEKVNLCRDEWYSLKGTTLLVPDGGVSSGLHFLTSDGSQCAALFRLPLPAFLVFVSALIGAWGVMLPFANHLYPYLSQWQLFIICSLMAQRSIIRCSDCRLYHSSCLLPLMLSRHELSERGVRLVFVTGAGAGAEAGPRISGGRGAACVTGVSHFLSTLRVDCSTIDILQAVAEGLGSKSLYVFVVDNPQAAQLYVQHFAGR